MSDTAFELGTKVTYTKTLSRYKDSHFLPKMHPETRKLIEPKRLGYYSYPSFWGENDPAPAPIHGIIVGKKTLSDGYTILDRDDGNQYYPVRHFTAWEVSYSLHRKPVLVLTPRHWFTFVQLPPVEYETVVMTDWANDGINAQPKLMRRPKPEPWEEVDDPDALREAMILAAQLQLPEGFRL